MTVRIAHISDTHFNERNRLEDTERAMDLFVEECRRREVDLILHAGDWYERASTPAERLAAVHFLINASSVAPVFGVKGNHDRPKDIDVFNFLGLRNVKVVDRPGVYQFRGRAHGRIFDTDEQKREGRLFEIAAVPWFDKQHVVAALPADASAEETRQLTIEQANALLTALAAQTGDRAISLFVGHVMVGGSEVSSGQTLIGTSVEFSPSDLLNAGFSYAAIGHVHKRQAWFAGRVAYSGSPTRCNFGEPEAKGFNLVTLSDAGEFKSNEFIDLPGRPMIREEIDLTKSVPMGGFFPEYRDDWKGAIVRVRILIRAQDLSLIPSADKIEAEYQRLTGAAELKVEIIAEAEQRQRAPEIVEAKSVHAKVLAYLNAKAIYPNVEDALRLAGKLDELERA